MNADALIGGLRERGYSVIRYVAPPTTLISAIRLDDPLFDWLQGLNVEMRPWPRDPLHRFEAQLHMAKVDVPEIENEPPMRIGVRRARAIWDAAGRQA